MPFYIKKLNNNIVFLALIHFLLGLFISGRKDVATIWGYGILFYGLIHIVRYRNKYDDASIFASYMVGIEVVLRTVGASVLWEYGKNIQQYFTTGRHVFRKYKIFKSKYFIFYLLCMSFTFHSSYA